MHVCHFCGSSVEGAYFRHLALGLIEKGVKISLVELGPHKPPSWIEQVPEIRYFSLGALGKTRLPSAAWKLSRLLKRERVDILHTHLYDAGLVAGMSKYLYKQPIYAYTRHHTSVVRMLGTVVHVKLDKWMAERADRLLTVSQAVRDYMRDVDQIDRDVSMIYLGFDFETFSPDPKGREEVRAEFGFSDTNFVVGYVGVLLPGKGHKQLVEAFSKVLDIVPHARLFLVGGGHLEEVDELIKHLELREKVILAGWRDDTPECLNAMDLFVQPSLSEAFSQVLAEAMAVGLPVVATKVGGAKEVISDGHNGVLIEPNLPNEITANVLRLYSEVEARKKMAQAGQAFVRENFGIARMVDAHYELYSHWITSRAVL